MTYQDTNQTVLTIINKVLTRLGVSEVSDLAQNKMTITAVGLFNDVIDDIADFGTGHWPHLYTETSVTLVSGQSDYKLNFNLKTLEEIVVSGQVQCMDVETKENIRRLNRANSGPGVPRQYAVISVSGLAPTIRVSPRPGNITTNFNIAYYTKPTIVRVTAADELLVFPFPSVLIAQGLYAAMLLDESGGINTTESVAATALYTKMKTEMFNRYTNDTGTDVYMVPTGFR